MLIYLFSVCKSSEGEFKTKLGCESDESEIVPAGILYMPASVNSVSVDAHSNDLEGTAKTKEFKRNGLVLDNVEIIRAMEAQGKGKVVPASIKEEKPSKKSEVKEPTYSTKGSIATIEKMEEIFDKTKKVIAKHCDEMTSGNASAEPLEYEKGKTSCEYCKMRSICRRY